MFGKLLKQEAMKHPTLAQIAEQSRIRCGCRLECGDEDDRRLVNLAAVAHNDDRAERIGPVVIPAFRVDIAWREFNFEARGEELRQVFARCRAC